MATGGGFWVALRALEGPDLLSGDPTRKFIRHMFGAIAEYEKDMIVFKLRSES